jgi:hypothetical protein
MSFWKKVLKKYKKQKNKDPKSLLEDKYINKLQKKLNKITQIDLKPKSN